MQVFYDELLPAASVEILDEPVFDLGECLILVVIYLDRFADIFETLFGD